MNECSVILIFAEQGTEANGDMHMNEERRAKEEKRRAKRMTPYLLTRRMLLQVYHLLKFIVPDSYQVLFLLKMAYV